MLFEEILWLKRHRKKENLMADLSKIQALREMIKTAHKEGLREVRVSVKMLEDFDEVITSLLVDRAEDYIKMKDYADKNSLDGEITFNGGSW